MLKAARPRFGALGKTGSLARIERLMRTLKDEGTRRILVPFRDGEMRSEIDDIVGWYNGHRPHEALGGMTPDEVWSGAMPVAERERFEVRPRYPLRARGSPNGDALRVSSVTLRVTPFRGRKHLPVIELEVAA